MTNGIRVIRHFLICVDLQSQGCFYNKVRASTVKGVFSLQLDRTDQYFDSNLASFMKFVFVLCLFILACMRNTYTESATSLFLKIIFGENFHFKYILTDIKMRLSGKER